MRNHAKSISACDFFVVATATFQLTYVFLIMEVGTRRLLHFNVTRHPTPDWALQQFRECVTGDEEYRFVIHDRDSIYSKELDAPLKALGLGCFEEAVEITAGKLVLRTTDRDRTSRVFGFHDSYQRRAHSADA